MQKATNTATVSVNTLECALELSKKTWLLAIQFPDREQPSVYTIKGGDAAALDTFGPYSEFRIMPRTAPSGFPKSILHQLLALGLAMR